MPHPWDGVEWPLRTERLAVRPARVEDEAAVYAFRRLPQVQQWITRAPATREDFHPLWVDPARLAVTLVIEHEGRVVGDLMLAIQDAWGQAEAVRSGESTAGVQAELGWVLDPAYAGRGLASEAVTALLGLCFDTLGLRRVVAQCFADNTASWRLMQRVGMRREAHTVRDSLHRSGRWLDALSYAVLAEEWAARGDPGR